MFLTIPGGHSAMCQLDPDPANVARARRLARQVLAEWRLADLTDVVTLVVSELVTNALRHGEDPITVRLAHADGLVRAEVHDHGTGRPVRRDPGAGDEDGRGLALIADLAELHGGELGMTADQEGPGKTVYATIAAPAEKCAVCSEVAPDGHRAAQDRQPGEPGLVPPAAVLPALVTELHACGVAASDITVTRLQARFALAAGLAVSVWHGWLFWPTGRVSRAGRPVYAMHQASDPAGAARRIAAARPEPAFTRAAP